MHKRQFGDNHNVREARKAQTRNLRRGVEECRGKARVKRENPAEVRGEQAVQFSEGCKRPGGEGCSVAGLRDNPCYRDLNLEKGETRAPEEGGEERCVACELM